MPAPDPASADPAPGGGSTPGVAPPGMPRGLVVVLVSLAALLVIGVGAVGVFAGRAPAPSASSTSDTARRVGPLALPSVSAPDAGSPECGRLLAALPATLPSGRDTLARRDLLPPAPQATAAWGSPRHDPVVVRCGVERPSELTPTAELSDVSGVRWLQIPSGDTITWLVVDRPVYVGLTEPADTGTGVLQGVSATIGATLPATAVGAH